MNWSKITQTLNKRREKSVGDFLREPGFVSLPAKTLLRVAHETYRRGYYRECSELVDRLCSARRTWPGWFLIKLEFLKGDALLDLKEYSDAVRCYSRLLRRKKSDIAFANKALALWELGCYRPALNNYLCAIELNAANAVAQRGAGEMYLKLGKPALALRHFQKAVKHRRNYGEALTGSGVALYQLGKWGHSFRTFQKAIQLDPEDWLAKKGLVALERELKQ